ncbi:YncE family protein [Solibacillus sp. FSL H8-0538]|uniref:YncE family protein n=1 Tax=Solibacillus sp. FSL H8-0538 TaxID=2921400 RepID=UPI0030F75B26
MTGRRIIYMSMLCVCLIAGCSNEHYAEVDPHQSFVASMNILQPSLTIYDKKAKEIATWSFEKAYTGAVLVGYDSILLYGHQLDEADLYELSSGKKLTAIETGLGVTNAYYNDASEQLFITNSRTNELSSYSAQGRLLQSIKLRNYPMSMAASGENLYVINYKDTVLSVVSMKDLQLVDEWDIAKSSHGILVLPEQDSIWIGGHGEGSSPNQSVDIYNLNNGKKVKEVAMPLMPVGFAKQDDEIAVISHGENELYVTDSAGVIKWQAEIGANPFAVAYFKKAIIVAGYDDQTLYFIQDGNVTAEIRTGKGPFQLLVREG